MNKSWILPTEPDSEKVRELSKAINVNPFLASLLISRGIHSYNLAKSFFRPDLEDLHDPFLMQDMDVAVERISKAVERSEKILIYGDYDVDGTCSVSLVYSFLSELYDHVYYYIPDRYKEGYGVSKDGIDFASENGISLIISLDCGIRAIEKVDYANQKGIDFIICDHHLPGEKLPNALAILDPKRKECNYPFKELCGCGVGFKLLQAFCLNQNIPLDQLFNYLDFVVIATASDIVPLIGENRILCFHGLQKINSNPLTSTQALIKVCGFQNAITISNIVFGIGPRINAAGRLKHAQFAVELLTEKDNSIVEEKAFELNANNLDRQELDRQTTEMALQMIENNPLSASKKSTVLYHEEWHKGIIGIVASRCIESYYKPTIILTESNGKAVGSARSVDGYDVYQAIQACEDSLIQFGGHKYAAGLTLSIDKVDEFTKKFEEAVSNTITEDQLIPKIKIAAEIELVNVTEKAYQVILQMAPFGPGNMTPIFMAKSVNIIGEPRLLKEKHLKFTVKQDDSQPFDCIGFDLGNYFEELTNGMQVDICFTLDMNEWKGRRNLQLMLKDLKVS